MPEKIAERGRLVFAAVLPWLLVIAFSLGFVQVFSPARYQLGALQIDVRVSAHYRGDTVVAVPPFGEVWAHSHKAPVRLSVMLTGLNVPELEQAVKSAQDRGDFVRRISADWDSLARRYGLRLIALGALGGLCGILAYWWLGPAGSFRRRRLRRNLLLGLSGVLVGVAAVSVLVTLTAATYDRRAFNHPRYVGALQAAPWIVGLAERGLDHIGEAGRKLEVISENLTTVFGSMDSLDAMGTGSSDVKVLLVSDLHNNPAGFDFVIQVAESFDADLIVDTGDITDFGTSIEVSLAGKLKTLGVPYVFIPGNHDSPEVVEYLRRLPKVVVADRGLVRVKGLTLFGMGDPASRSGQIVSTPDEYRRHSAELALAVQQLDAVPDIVAVHSSESARGVAGTVPVLVYGHDHRAAVKQVGDTVVVDAGTTGANGIRALQSKGSSPYSVALLHFITGEDAGEPTRLTAVDAIRVDGPGGKLTLERRVFQSPGTELSASIP